MPFNPTYTTVVLIHGGASSSRMYRTTTPILNNKGYTNIICPDLPGHGASGTSTGPFTFAKSTAFLEDILADIKSQSPCKGRVLLVGVSLGGQAVLHYLTHTDNRSLVDAALVSGVTIHPPDERAAWDMPRLPTDDQVWMDIIMEDVSRMGGIDVAQGLQKESFGFALETPMCALPPVLVVIGEHDYSLAKRDFEELFERLGDEIKGGNGRSEKLIMEGAWHNHPIDVPEAFAEVVADWAVKILN